MKASAKNFVLKTALFLAPFFALWLSGCTVDPAADGNYFSRTFRYYYAEECRYDAVGPYDCSLEKVLSPSYKVTLRIDSDGFASLNLDGESYYYTESSYDEGFDDGSYFMFEKGDLDVKIYKDGSEMSIWDSWNNRVTFYYYE